MYSLETLSQVWLHAKGYNAIRTIFLLGNIPSNISFDIFFLGTKSYKSEFSLPSRILRLGQNFQQLVVGQEEESREEETFPLQIFVQTLLDIL